MKKKFSKNQILNLIDKVIDHNLFKPICISIIITFVLFKSFGYLQDFVEERQEISTKEKEVPIKINIPHPGDQFDLEEDQILEHKIKPGDTILKVLFELGAEESDVFAILTEMKKVYNPSSIEMGQRIFVKYRVKINYKKDGPTGSDVGRTIIINKISIASSPEKEVVITRNKDGSYKSEEIVKKLIKYVVKYSGIIKNGLFNDGVDVGVSPNIMINMVNMYSFDVDFQRDIRDGDKFELIYESFYDANGKRVKDGEILFSSLTLQRRTLDIYMHKINGVSDYFDIKGNSVRKSLLRTPINGARISSGFGVRRHPILGYSKMHKGIDFAAPMGTPIFAAGAGTIDYYSRKGGYGNFVRIKHNADYATAYGHASRFVKNLHIGSKVRQGQVVAHVGSTGNSTGPHLHYEILYRGAAINPGKVKTTSGIKLSGKELAKFNNTVAEIERYRKNIPNQNSKLKS